jgi:transposase
MAYSLDELRRMLAASYKDVRIRKSQEGTMASVEIQVDLPTGVTLREYERIGQGHAFHVEWTLPDTVTCEQCRTCQTAQPTYKNTFYVVRDLELWGLPSFFVYQPPVHACSRCGRRQELASPFKRKHVTYTYRFEEHVLSLLIGSNAEEVGRRLGISAEMVDTIVQHQLADQRPLDPQRRITDVGLDEISLRKGHQLYATVLTDLTDPSCPQVLAVAGGRDQAAGEQCLQRLSPEQRQQVQTHRTDMGAAYTAACRAQLPNSQQVIDRFHVAQKLGDVADGVRKKRPANTNANSRRPSGGNFVLRCGRSVVAPSP